jgi:uncharacterized protein YecE (DUF72 family)
VRLKRENDLDDWQRIVRALEEKVDDFYGYVNNHYSGHAPTIARYLKDLLSDLPRVSNPVMAKAAK